MKPRLEASPPTEADMDAWYFAVVRTRGYPVKGRYFRVRDLYRSADSRDADIMLAAGRWRDFSLIDPDEPFSSGVRLGSHPVRVRLIPHSLAHLKVT